MPQLPDNPLTRFMTKRAQQTFKALACDLFEEILKAHGTKTAMELTELLYEWSSVRVKLPAVQGYLNEMVEDERIHTDGHKYYPKGAIIV